MNKKKVVEKIGEIIYYYRQVIGAPDDIKEAAKEIYNHRKELGLFMKQDIEIDETKLDIRWDILYDEDIDPIIKWWLNGEEIKVTSFEDLAKAIADKKPIKVILDKY